MNFILESITSNMTIVILLMSLQKCDIMLWEKHLTNQEDKYSILFATGVNKEFINGVLT